MRRLFALALGLGLALAQPARAEEIVAGLSQSRVALTANFDGSEIIVYGAIRREAPQPEGPLDIIVTVEGPPAPVTVRRKARVFGIWVNREAVRIRAAPSFYAIAATRPLEAFLSQTDDLRHRITIPKAIRAVGATQDAADAPTFTEALIRLRKASGAYLVQESPVDLAEATLFRTDVVLPANLSEGLFRVRVFLVRDGAVIDALEVPIEVHKDGIERTIYALSQDQPLLYGLLALAIAAVAGWAASAGFRALRL